MVANHVRGNVRRGLDVRHCRVVSESEERARLLPACELEATARGH